MDIATKTQRECEERVAEEYLSSLSDLNCNSKPLINMLTMLAEENIEYAAVIVKVVEQHIAKVPPEIKLPILYLIDSIVKNVKSTYVQLFSQCIVNLFCGVFEKVNEKIRERMYALRQTWNEVFSAQKLYALDVKIKRLDNNWPITAKQPSIHVNPNFLKTANQAIPTEMEKILQDKTRELLELKKRKLELELEATKKHLEEQEKQFSKTAEGVLPPVDALVVANALQTVGIRPAQMGGQVIPPVMAPGYMGPQGMALNHMRPSMYHHNIRGFRPNLHPAMMGDQSQAIAPVANMGPNINKPRVHPVNSALISSVRQRDPRLARQQQQQQLQQQQPQQQMQPQQLSNHQQHALSNPASASINQNQAAPVDTSKSSRNERNHKSNERNRKSPTRSTSTSNSSSSRSSSSRSGKSSSREKDRDRNKRSGSLSKSSSSVDRKKSASTSSYGSKLDKHSSSSSSSAAAKCDKDAFEIAPLSSAFKRKSTSPSSSPSKSRESKRSNKSRSSRSKTSSRSPSPESMGSYKNVNSRRMSTTSSSSASIMASPEKKISKLTDTTTEQDMKMSAGDIINSKDGLKSNVVDSTSAISSTDKTLPLPESSTGLMDIDLRPHLVPDHSMPRTASTLDSNLNTVISMTNAMTSFVRNIEDISSTSARQVAISSPKVSFKIQKSFNKLEKSTENLLSAPSTSFTGNNNNNKNASTTTPAVVGNDVKTKSEFDMKDIKRDMDGVGNAADSSARDEVSKDHDEDVKKRPLAPIKDEEPLAKKSKPTKLDNLFGSEDVDLRQLMPPLSVNTQDDTAPPPPPFNLSTESNENWDNVKTDVAKTPSTKKSSFEDVRAKLAKTAKLNKLLKLDKQNKDIDHRNKLAELQMNEDTQEANDEKIRTMIAQAQELLESKSINQEQYKNLVKNVMSINEDYKLKEAKRRESLNAFRDRSNNDDGSNDSSERNAAREAIFKKRIPKLSKTSSEAINSEILNEGSCGSGNMDEPMRLADDKHDSNDEPPMRSSRREKRGGGHKVSKWGDRVPDPPMMPSGPRPWNSLMQQNKRGGAPMPFRPNIPPNVRPPWQMGNNNNNNGPPHFPKAGPPMGPHMRGSNVIPPIGPQSPIPPPMIPRPCNSIDNPQEDIVRTITIDGAAKEIRFYDHVAIVFMEVDQPREIGFQNGQRTIFIDNHEPITLQFNHDYKPVTIDGETYNLRFGFPSRELFIDDHWYEIYFGGPAINVPIRNKMHMLKAEGPPPQVNIGNLRRDLVVGKINMIVDAHNVIPLFLDARVQTFKLGDMDHTIQFADNLLTVLLDGTPTRVEYGGLPKSLYLGTNKYFIRFGALPQGIIAGKVQIKDMIYVETKPPANADPIFNTPPAAPMLAPTEAELGQVDLQKPAETSVPILPAAALSSINIDELFQKLVSTGILGGSSGILPAVNSNTQTSASSVESSVATKPTTADSAGEEVPQPTPASVTTEAIKPIDLSKPESIKTRQSAIVATLFSGMQCSSCGVRFPPEQTIKYSQHLDWHFRQNRRERDSSRKAHSRKWYYDLNDWIQYEEIEDVDEREKNFFDTPQTDIEIMDETSNQRSTNSPIQSCPAGPDDVDRACDMCQEKFEHFYNEELEEWHLRCAIRVEEKTYHPLCYEDYKASLNPPQPAKEEEEVEDTTEEPSLIQIDDDNAVDIVIKVEEDSKEKSDSAAKLDDEDDDVIVLPNEEPSVTEIYDDDDDDEYVPANVTREHMGTVHEEDEGGDLNETNESDVEIQEPHIPFTDLDTYVEKELPEGTSRDTFMNVKIKEEPNAEEDEDDGFEDVGTVLIAPDEISIHSSEETQTQLIESSTSAMSPIVERPASTTPSVINDEIETNTDMPITDLNNSMDGNIETGDEHNLSAAGPVPAMPLASLVNKIKINITKNTVTTNSTASSSNSSSTMSSNTCKSNSANSNTSSLTDHSKGSIGSSASGATTFNHIPTISTIPVLCGGGTTITSTQSSIGGGGLYDEPSNIPSLSGSGGGVSDNSVSSISVIGSIYGSNGPATVIRPIPQATNVIPPAKPATPPPPPPVEETITYELKPELQKATLKKKEKVICGNETSGLCSIM